MPSSVMRQLALVCQTTGSLRRLRRSCTWSKPSIWPTVGDGASQILLREVLSPNRSAEQEISSTVDHSWQSRHKSLEDCTQSTSRYFARSPKELSRVPVLSIGMTRRPSQAISRLKKIAGVPSASTSALYDRCRCSRYVAELLLQAPQQL